MQGGGCGAAAGYYGAPCGGNYRLGQPRLPDPRQGMPTVVGACGPSVGACGPQVGAFAGFPRGARRGLGSPEERHMGSPEEFYSPPPFDYVGAPRGGGGGHHGGGHHGGFHGGRRFGGGGWWGGWGWGWPYYGWDYDGYGSAGSQCVYDQRTGRYVCYVWDPTRNAWVVVG